MWCHVLLMMPLLGLGLFALLPWPMALPSYLALVAVSLGLYVKILQGMRQPVQTGREAMLGAVVTVTRDIASQGQVRYGNELWSAVSEQRLTAGQRAHASWVLMACDWSSVGWMTHSIGERCQAWQ
jgi:membrane protein implicated in regulation of membrane protease activity